MQRRKYLMMVDILEGYRSNIHQALSRMGNSKRFIGLPTVVMRINGRDRQGMRMTKLLRRSIVRGTKSIISPSC
ncbi:hypothetical protein ACFSFW_23365 [Fredinandcohnia salidurans]|uniref:Uncharacterized protein n=1 Tax=Fredinandcohnia salidurans TaxID=2595041 RepID=A0ABW4MUN5_9BACI